MERLESMATSASPLLSPILRSLIRLFESLIDVWSGIEKLKVSPEEELLGPIQDGFHNQNGRLPVDLGGCVSFDSTM
jgi:hypothetical protein